MFSRFRTFGSEVASLAFGPLSGCAFCDAVGLFMPNVILLGTQPCSNGAPHESFHRGCRFPALWESFHPHFPIFQSVAVSSSQRRPFESRLVWPGWETISLVLAWQANVLIYGINTTVR
jgi:hypothetical protein